MAGRLQRASAYETWVLTVRAWAADPTTPLDHLPVLDDATFTPDTYDRLFRYILEALRAVSERWQAGLQRAWQTSSNSFELGRELVQLRATLSRRLQLAGHPALPEKAREILLRDTRESIACYQRELEANVTRLHTSGRVDRKELDRMLMVVRENSFVGLLDYVVGHDGSRPTPGALPPTHPRTPAESTVRSPRWAHRRVVALPCEESQ